MPFDTGDSAPQAHPPSLLGDYSANGSTAPARQVDTSKFEGDDGNTSSRGITATTPLMSGVDRVCFQPLNYLLDDLQFSSDFGPTEKVALAQNLDGV